MRDRKGVKTAEGHSGGPGRNTEREIIIRLCSMREDSIFSKRKETVRRPRRYYTHCVLQYRKEQGKCIDCIDYYMLIIIIPKEQGKYIDCIDYLVMTFCRHCFLFYLIIYLFVVSLICFTLQPSYLGPHSVVYFKFSDPSALASQLLGLWV